ncbi:MAG: UDP-N-acetylmuramoyl-tripeptide--D-alanyl-D-alanine ligase [Candidatus Omnitrophota bacterium]
MIDLRLKDLADAAGGRILRGAGEQSVKGISIDSRTVRNGDMFAAVRGKNFDGHDFVKEALDRGASGIIVSRKMPRDIMDMCGAVLEVGEVTPAAADIAGEIRKRMNGKVIAVTGSNGKTTVKDMLSWLLSGKDKVLASKRSFNNIIGLSLTLFDAEPYHETAVLELGTNHPGEMAVLGRIARPDVIVITNIGRAHMEFFSSKEGVLKEKTALTKYLRQGGKIFVNGDDPLLRDFGDSRDDVISFGMSGWNDMRIEDVSRRDGGYRFRLQGKSYFFPQDGLHNVYNVSAAIAVALDFVGESPSIEERVRTVALPPMRLERVTAGGIDFINDSYNANPDSFKCALDVLSENACKGGRVVVAGDMMEMGEESEAVHRELGRRIAESGADMLVAVGTWSDVTAEGALAAGMDKGRVTVAKDHGHAAEIIKNRISEGSCVLLKGSRAAKMEDILKCFMTYSIR